MNRSPARSGRSRLAGLALAGMVVAGCGGPILALPPVERPGPPETSPMPSMPPDPIAIEFPRDDGPHRRLTEWWYYTGHLVDEAGGRYGFEFVIFRAERGDVPVSWAAHLAITDEGAGRFLYAQRTEVGPAVDQSPTDGNEPIGLALRVVGDDPGSRAAGHPAWQMSRTGDLDTLDASLTASEAEAAGSRDPIGLSLRGTSEGVPVLHDRDGWIDFGPAGGSYYYSRTRLAVDGALTLDGMTRDVRGTAWFDHQWGDFIAVGGGGWDWFAVGLEDGTDVTISQVRDASGGYPLVYGTLVRPDGSVRHLPREALTVTVTDHWTSPRTGATYPAGWTITIPGDRLLITLRPTLADQELDTRSSTGVVYWEGSQIVRAVRDRRFIGGEAYVELTGYADGG